MWNDDAYVCRSNMAHVIGACLEIDQEEPLPRRQFVKRLDEWRKTVANFWGDFWPLTPYSLEGNVWMAWQFDWPEAGEGVVQAFRRERMLRIRHASNCEGWSRTPSMC